MTSEEVYALNIKNKSTKEMRDLDEELKKIQV